MAATASLAGELYRLSNNIKPTVVTALSNEHSLTDAIHQYKGKGHLPYFTRTVTEAKAALVRDLRDAGVAVAAEDETHLRAVEGVRCRDEAHCEHVLTGPEIRARCLDCEDKILGAGGEHWTRVLVACDPERTKLRDDCMECFVRDDGGIVVRVHLHYPNSIPCGSSRDQRGRLVTQKYFVATDAAARIGFHALDYVKRGAKHASVPDHEALFPFTPKAIPDNGFDLVKKCTAITVETVFTRDASRTEPPFYAEDEGHAQIYFSYLRATEFVTDDELVEHFPKGPVDALAMPAYAEDRNVEKYNVLVRLYLLAHDQGWTSTLTHKSPHPLGNARLPVLFRLCATDVAAPDRHNRHAPAYLQQSLLPDVESQITRFCFRRIVSEALRQRVVACAEAEPERHIAVVCYLPHGNRVPAFTDAQIDVLAGLYPALSIRKPATRADWARLSQTLYQHGADLLGIFQALGTPLRDADGNEIATDAYVPYTADLRDAFFLVVANRPLRDYTCVMNQRWLLEELLLPDYRTAASPRAFAAWVRYWDTIVQLKHELEDQLSVDVVSAHLGQRLAADAATKAQRAACLVNGRVADHEGGVVFPELQGRRYCDYEKVVHLPVGSAVVYKVANKDGELSFQYMRAVFDAVEDFPVFRVPSADVAVQDNGAQSPVRLRGWRPNPTMESLVAHQLIRRQEKARGASPFVRGKSGVLRGTQAEVSSDKPGAAAVPAMATVDATSRAALPPVIGASLSLRRVGLGVGGYGGLLRPATPAAPASRAESSVLSPDFGVRSSSQRRAASKVSSHVFHHSDNGQPREHVFDNQYIRPRALSQHPLDPSASSAPLRSFSTSTERKVDAVPDAACDRESAAAAFTAPRAPSDCAEEQDVGPALARGKGLSRTVRGGRGGGAAATRFQCRVRRHDTFSNRGNNDAERDHCSEEKRCEKLSWAELDGGVETGKEAGAAGDSFYDPNYVPLSSSSKTRGGSVQKLHRPWLR